jgi:hypothetical protein
MGETEFHSISYSVLRYPSSLIALEKEIRLGELSKRFDILVYDGRHQPWLMVGQAPGIPLNDDTLQQVLRYNICSVSYLVITNGHYTLTGKKPGLT